MKKLLKSALCLRAVTVLLALMAAVNVLGQNKTITGTVVDAQGTPVIGA